MAKRKVIRKIGNSTVTETTWKKILSSKAFRIGFEDYLSGKPFQYDKFIGEEAWSYERGRQFAANGYNRKFKQGNKVLDEAIVSFAESYNVKHIR